MFVDEFVDSRAPLSTEGGKGAGDGEPPGVGGGGTPSPSPLVSKWVEAYIASIELDFADRPYLVRCALASASVLCLV